VRAVYVVIGAAIAAIVLALVVLIGHPNNEVDLLAGAGLAAGVGLLAAAIPPIAP
jgi:hypothetical protein